MGKLNDIVYGNNPCTKNGQKASWMYCFSFGYRT